MFHVKTWPPFIHHACVRSVMDYAIPVFYYALPQYLQNDLKRLEKRTMAIIVHEENYSDTTIQYNTIQYNTIQYNTIQYNTIQYNTIQYNTIQYNTIQYLTNIKHFPC